MRFSFLILGLFLAAPLSAKVLVSPIEAMKLAFGERCSVRKKNILLTKNQAAAVRKTAHMKLSTKIYRTYTATSENGICGYGILITRKVRSKDAAVLYTLTPTGRIKQVEIIAFNEPPEFIPPKTYLRQFEHKSEKDALRVGKDIPTISGATLSARNVTDGARLALAVFETVIKKRP